VLIAKLVDTDGNGVDAGDRIVMGSYPTVFSPQSPSDFGEWTAKTHTVHDGWLDPMDTQVHDDDGVMFRWMSDYHGSEGYEEGGGGTVPVAFVGDYVSCPIVQGTDMIYVESGSPSLPDQPVGRVHTAPVNRCTDHFFVDVEIR
jgi:hypothetical protein